MDSTPGSSLTRHSFETSIDIETPEQVSVAYSVAGIGSRGAAAAIDLFICMLIMGVTSFLLVVAAAPVMGRSVVAMGTPVWLGIIFVVLQFLLMWGYHVISEARYDGQTIGKRIMKIRVVQDGGYSISWGAAAVRNLLRALDAQPFPTYLIGIVSAMFNVTGKRLGDLVAGTFVIQEGLASTSPKTKPDTTDIPVDATVPYRAPRLRDDEYALLEQFMVRRKGLNEESQQRLARQLSTRFSALLSDSDAKDKLPLLTTLYNEERASRASAVAARTDTGSHREQQAIVAFGMKRWNDFANALTSARSRGFENMSSREVSGFVAQYRELTTDYARLRTATRGRPSDALFYLSRLVARGHGLVYRRRSNILSTTRDYLTGTIPREIRRSWRPVLFAATVLFLPGIVSYVAVTRHPQTIPLLVPDEMLSRATSAGEREKRGEGYVTITPETRPLVASFIITNNIQVTYFAFALGITAGIGTLLILLFNGIALGAGIGVFAQYDVTRVILAFIAPHGVLELTAVCLGGGAGLLIGVALLLPGRRTRREALVENGKRAITLIAGANVLLVIAGVIEGMVSPRVWPLSWKLTVSAITAVALIWYITLGRARRVIPAPVAPALQ